VQIQFTLNNILVLSAAVHTSDQNAAAREHAIAAATVAVAARAQCKQCWYYYYCCYCSDHTVAAAVAILPVAITVCSESTANCTAALLD
jgi:hypothetical protein